MPTKLFKKQDLLDTIYGDGCKSLKQIEDTIAENTRWSIVHEFVFQEVSTGDFYYISYSVGATEQQDERPFEYDGDDIKCVLVKPEVVSTTVYKEVK